MPALESNHALPEVFFLARHLENRTEMLFTVGERRRERVPGSCESFARTWKCAPLLAQAAFGNIPPRFPPEGISMASAKQLSVPVENRPGTLAQVARALGDAKVNILAFLTTTSGGEGAVHVVVDNVDKAKKALDSAGLSYSEADVLHIELRNAPGALGQFAEKLAANDINITSGYQTTAKNSKKASLVLAVSDLEKAARIR